AEDRPRERVPGRRAPARGRHGREAGLPRASAVPRQALADAGDAYFLPRRRGRRGREEVARETLERSAAFLRLALDVRPPGRGERRRQREHREEGERGV